MQTEEIFNRETERPDSLGLLEKVPSDVSPVEARSFSGEKLNEYLSDSGYNYDRTINTNPGWWERLLKWLQNLFGSAVEKPEQRERVNTTLYIIAGIVMVFVILKLIGIDMLSLFSKKAASTALRTELLDEDIHALNFDDLISKAIAENDYRLAVRLLYLKSLKQLSDRSLIRWEINKTNRDYARELTRSPLRADFENITYFFEHVWYGQFEVNNRVFEHGQSLFRQFHDRVSRS